MKMVRSEIPSLLQTVANSFLSDWKIVNQSDEKTGNGHILLEKNNMSVMIALEKSLPLLSVSRIRIPIYYFDFDFFLECFLPEQFSESLTFFDHLELLDRNFLSVERLLLAADKKFVQNFKDPKAERNLKALGF